MKSPPEPKYLAGVDPDTLAGLVFELAAQMHTERQHRLALECALVKNGMIDAGLLASLSEDATVLEQARAGADQSIRSLLRIVMEDGDLKTPLRNERVSTSAQVVASAT